ncbi:MAG TPA: glycosyltransferase family 87 protein [Phycisphaerae bacterium]|nr:glycosyltransferase family 87 protein [Phycisphaerae bacterium]
MRSIHIILWIFIASTMIVLAVQAHNKVAHEMTRQAHIDAFDSYMQILPGFLHQHKPYTNDDFPLPPFAMLFIAPFTFLSRPDAQMAWVLIKPLFFIPIFYLCLSMVRRGGGAIGPVALGLIMIVWFFPVIGDIQEGQMNLLMLLPLTIALWLAQDQTPRSDIGAGLMLAMAVCIKVTPLAFVAYFVFRRRWRLVVWTLAGGVLWLLVIPAVFFGWDQNVAWLGQWGNIMIVEYVLHGTVKFTNGESIPELITRLFSHQPAWQIITANGSKQNHYMNILNLSLGTVRLMGRLVLLAIAAIGIVWAGRRLSSQHCRRYVMEIACVGLFMLWASERTWVAHYVLLIFALMAAGMIASDELARTSSRRLAWAALIFAAILMPWTSNLDDVLGPQGRDMVVSVDVVLWISFYLALAIITAQFRDRAERATIPAPAPGWGLYRRYKTLNAASSL